MTAAKDTLTHQHEQTQQQHPPPIPPHPHFPHRSPQPTKMHLNADISSALKLLEQLKSDIVVKCPDLEDDTCQDLQLLISALENPALRGQALLQDSLGHLSQQLLKDPELTVDGFDITFAGRLLLDDGHYSEPVYESPDEDRETKRNHLSTLAVGRQKPKHDFNDVGNKPDTTNLQLRSEPRRYGDDHQHIHGGDHNSRYKDTRLGIETRRPRGGPGNTWPAADHHHPLSRSAMAPPPPPPTATPLISIPLQTTPVLLSSTPQTPTAILLQIPLLTPDTATAAATAGLTINDLYLGRMTPEHQVPPGGGGGGVGDGGVRLLDEGGVAALIRASSVDSDRSANGSDTASSVNSGWSKSSSIVRVSYGDDGQDRTMAGGASLPKRYTETSPDGTPPPASTKPCPTFQLYPHPYPFPYPYPHHQQQLPTPDDDFYAPEEAVWSPVPASIELVKGARGLGFSIGEQRYPKHPRGAVVVVRSLVEKGVAQADGRLRPGDRLVAVNGRPLTEGSLDEAVIALKGAPLGPVTVDVLRRVWRESAEPDEGHYEEIDEKKETRQREHQQESPRKGVGDAEESVGMAEDLEEDGREADKVWQPPKMD